MKGIDKISARIEADARLEVEAIEAEARRMCEEIEAEYKAKATEIYEKRIAAGKADCTVRSERLGAVADMEARKSILVFKQEMVSEAFDKAVEAIVNMPEKDYVEFLANQAVAASSDGKEKLVFSRRDAGIAEAVAERANALLRECGRKAELSVSAETAEIPGGIILRRGDIEVNCDVDALVQLSRKSMAAQVAGILFD